MYSIIQCKVYVKINFNHYANIDFRQPSDVKEVNEEAIVNSESKGNEGGGWWDSLYSAAKSKVLNLYFYCCFIISVICFVMNYFGKKNYDYIITIVIIILFFSLLRY